MATAGNICAFLVGSLLYLIGSFILGVGAVMQFPDERPEWVVQYRLYMGIAFGFALPPAFSSSFGMHQPPTTGCASRYPRPIDRCGPRLRNQHIPFLADGWQLGNGGSQARVETFLQNVHEGACTGRLQLNPKGTTSKIPQANLPLE